MQAPTGCSGVQALPNNGHSSERILPVSTSPQRQAVLYWLSSCGIPYFFRASKSERLSCSMSPEPGITPMPRHSASTGVSISATSFRALGLPSAVTTRG